jgi:prevent-host-death family protein
MKKIDIHEARTRLPALIDRVAAGERIVICRRNLPVAEIRPVPRPRRSRRPIGLAKGFEVSPSFFEAMPEEVLAEFQGR